MKAREAAAERAKVEKAERKETAAELSDEIKLEQLRQIPKAERTADEQREFERLYRRARRRDERGEQSSLSKVEDAESFWAANTATLTKAKLEELLAQQELTLDQEFWMEHGGECDPSDENFVSLEEGMRDLDAFIAAHGLIHDEPQACQHPEVRELRPAWGLFVPKDTYDKVWGRVEAFYKNAEHFNALCSESRATRPPSMARFGRPSC